MQLNTCDCSDSCCSESHALLKGADEFVWVLSDLGEIWCV
jgi:hypothetical protein